MKPPGIPGRFTAFEKLVILRVAGKPARMNHAIAWALVVAYVTSILR